MTSPFFHQQCTNCVMDTTDSAIFFDNKGVCNHCHHFKNKISKTWFPNTAGSIKLQKVFRKVKKERKRFDYDCILGLSGGLDSSYLALVIKKYKIRPLVVHVDTGWNSETAVSNLEKIIKYCNFDLHTHVVNWPEVRDLQLAYLEASVANQDVVQDHVIFASLYHFAVKNQIKYVISGGNIATEGVFPVSWHHAAMDKINLEAIHKKFGKLKLESYKTISFYQYYFYFTLVKRMQVIRPLNYIPYSKVEAFKELQEAIGYKSYPRKHGESRFTKFFQNCYLPTKFGIDKRKPHLSSMVLSGLITREQALEELKKKLYDENELREDKKYIAKKLGITVAQLEEYITSPGQHYSKYPNWDILYNIAKKCQWLLAKALGHDVKKYS